MVRQDLGWFYWRISTELELLILVTLFKSYLSAQGRLSLERNVLHKELFPVG